MHVKNFLHLKENTTISYIGEPSIEKVTFLFLSPGASDATFFTPYLKYLKGLSYIIPDYPGRGDSSIQRDNSVLGVAVTLNDLLEKMHLESVVIVAYSYGTQVASELIKLNPNRYNSIHLVAPGQYFGKYKRLLLKGVFILPFKVESLLEFFRSAIVKLKYFDDSFPKKNLKQICAQWLGTLDYVYSNEYINIPTYLYFYADDDIVDKSSLRSNSPANNVFSVSLSGKHPLKLEDYSEFEINYLRKILKVGPCKGPT